MKKQVRFKRNGATKLRPVEVVSTVYEGCLAADSYWTIPVSSGQRFRVDAWLDVGCDSRGWSCDNWVTRSGPMGKSNYFVWGSIGYPTAPIGMLIGAISRTNAGASMDQDESRRIFGGGVLPIGERYEANSPIKGFLYLIFNDTWTWGDNKGSIKVRVTLDA